MIVKAWNGAKRQRECDSGETLSIPVSTAAAATAAAYRV